MIYSAGKAIPTNKRNPINRGLEEDTSRYQKINKNLPVSESQACVWVSSGAPESIVGNPENSTLLVPLAV